MSTTTAGRSNETRDRVAGRMGDRMHPANSQRTGKKAVLPTVRLALLWGCSPRAARERLDRAFRDGADIVTTYMALGEHDALAQRMAPLDAALNAWAGPPALSEATVNEADADTGEDSAAARYHVAPSRATALQWVRSLARQCFHSERLMASLRLRWEL